MNKIKCVILAALFVFVTIQTANATYYEEWNKTGYGFIDSVQQASQIELKYDTGITYGGWSMGDCTANTFSPNFDGGCFGQAVRFSPISTFTINSIKVYGQKYGRDSNMRIEIWDKNKNVIYKKIINHLSYFTTSWGWSYINVPGITVSGDFYVILFTGSLDSSLSPTTGVYIGSDTGPSSGRSYTVSNYNVLGWNTIAPRTFNWMIRARGTYQSNNNLLKNPGFEETYLNLPKYWNKYQFGTKAIFTYPEIGRTGKGVAIKYTTIERVALWRQSGINAVPGKQYKLSGYMKLASVNGGGASLRINWYRSGGQDPNNGNPAVGLIRADMITKSGTIGWTKYEKIFTAPPNAVKATVIVDLAKAKGKVWFDDISFVRIS